MHQSGDNDLFSRLILIKPNLYSGLEGKKRGIFYKQLYDYTKNVNQQMSDLALKERHSCQEGCSFCCYQTFAVYPAEVEVISYYLLENEDLLKKFIEKVSVREKLIQPHLELLEKCAESEEAFYEFYKLKIPCAFLDDGSCSIYPVRSVTCSSHISRNSPRICAIDPKGFCSGKMNELKLRSWLWLKARSLDCFKQDKALVDVSHLVFENLIKLADLPVTGS